MLLLSKEAALLPLFIFGVSNIYVALCDENETSDKTKRQFSLFSVVTFGNEECSSEPSYGGGQVQGTCYTDTECTDKGGAKSGNCAAGFGVCCIFIYKTLTSKTITENRTYIQNPLFPDVETTGAGTTIVYTISKMNSDICQVRLDFDYFVIAGPGNTREDGVALADGNCLDKLSFTMGGAFPVPTLCGVMTDQHLYMDMGFLSSDTAAITLALGSTTTVAGDSGIAVADAFRKFRVKTSQIPCWASYRAPDGCHQYFTTLVGEIVSPNFGQKGKIGSSGENKLNAGYDLMNLDLKYCIRREKNHCCTLYQVCNSYEGVDLSVTVGTGTAANGELSVVSEGWSFHAKLINAGTANNDILAAANNDVGHVDGGCTTDYLEIAGSTTGKKSYGASVQLNSRYCGVRFGYMPPASAVGATTHSPVYDCDEPYALNYHTDQMADDGDQGTGKVFGIAYRGFCLDFRQTAC